jgi:hypothetical protein
MPSLSITDIIVRSYGLVCHLNKLFTVSGARPGVRGMVNSLIGDKLLLLDISWLMQRFRYGVFNLHFRQWLVSLLGSHWLNSMSLHKLDCSLFLLASLNLMHLSENVLALVITVACEELHLVLHQRAKKLCLDPWVHFRFADHSFSYIDDVSVTISSLHSWVTFVFATFDWLVKLPVRCMGYGANYQIIIGTIQNWLQSRWVHDRLIIGLPNCPVEWASQSCLHLPWLLARSSLIISHELSQESLCVLFLYLLVDRNYTFF